MLFLLLIFRLLRSFGVVASSDIVSLGLLCLSLNTGTSLSLNDVPSSSSKNPLSRALGGFLISIETNPGGRGNGFGVPQSIGD